MSGLSWQCPTRLVVGAGSFGAVVREESRQRGRIVVVTDARMAGTPSARALAATLAAVTKGASPDVVAITPSGDGLGDIAWLAGEIAGAGVVVGVGGGSVLDVVKLATAGPHAFDYLRAHARRSGLVRLPANLASFSSSPRAFPRRVLVPTTVGTSSEVSLAACVLVDGARRLVLGSALPPDVAVLDPLATSSLPSTLLVEGVFEALLRVAGPYAGTTRPDRVADRIAEATASALIELGDRLTAAANGVADGAVDGAVDDEVRLDAARLSSYTQVGWAMLGRDSYSAKAWFFANELAAVAGVRKVVATACLLPALWRRMLAGDARFGDGRRLTALWSRIAGAGDPVDGLEFLLQRWGIDRFVMLDPAGVDGVGRVADRLLQLWGGRLPMLAGLTRDDITAVLAESVTMRDRTPSAAGAGSGSS